MTEKKVSPFFQKMIDSFKKVFERNPVELASPLASPKPSPASWPSLPSGYEETQDGHIRRIDSSPTPSSTPTPSSNNSRYFDYAGSGISSDKIKLQQPSEEIANLIFQMFEPDKYATPAAAIIAGENANFDPKAIGWYNRDMSRDYGLSQVNENNLTDLLRRRPTQAASYGISPLDNPITTLLDAYKNLGLMRMTLQEGGKGRFYGWKGDEQYSGKRSDRKIEGIPDYQPYLDYINGVAPLQQN